MPEQQYVFSETVYKPHFDCKVALTTRGWSWEIEVKDCQTAEQFSDLFDAAKAEVTRKMAGLEQE